MKRHLPVLVYFLAAIPLLISSSSHAADPRPISYNRDIRPLLSDRCFHCHGPDGADRQATLRLDQADGEEGAYRDASGVVPVKPGSLEESELWQRIISQDPDSVMPPADSHKKALTKDEQELIRRWIEQGANYESFWAFIPATSPLITERSITEGEAAASSPIDQLVRRRLAEEGHSPAPVADLRTLIRRVTLDLTGLPPTRAEIEAFLNDDTPDAYEKLVDCLLDSPHYGEHMAKYWLDVVRFADTNGIHHDHYRDLSTYRDWVIRSFNDNLPYADFVRYQIAGDLYDHPQQDQLVASGFNRLHLIIDVGTMLPEESFSRNVIDRVSSVGTAFLGLTLQCAVCHDLKYDPITQRDFFSLAGFFNNIDAEPETGGRRGADFLRGLQEPYIDLPSAEQAEQLRSLKQAVESLTAQVAQAKEQLSQIKASIAQSEAANESSPAQVDQGQTTDKPETTDEPKTTENDEALKEAKAALAAGEKQLAAAQKAHDDYLLTVPAAMIMKERAEVRPSHMLIRGAYDNPGEVVERATPGFLPPMKSDHQVKSRMDLANWLVDPQHPLTARVTVNRFWQQLFGIGLVRTSEDFGAQGEWPSHPELLDYLAVRIVKGGWDVKSLMKAMVMSETYQQSSIASPEAYQNDPQNRLLARGSRFRLDSEVIRDQILATSGKLNRELFGKSVKPPQPEGLWKALSLPSSYPNDYSADSGDKIYRRSLYTFWKRAMPPPQMSIFNAPNREECVARRERTNTPLQALLLMNETEYLKAARQLASDILVAATDDRQRLSMIYETITSQLPAPQIAQDLQELAIDLRKLYQQSPELAAALCADITVPESITHDELAAWTLVASAVYNLDITKTKQ